VHPHAIRLEFACTNNEAEYEALIQGMILAQEMKIDHIIVTGNFELVINQVTQRYKIKKERLKLYFKRVNELMEAFDSFNISSSQGTKIKRQIHWLWWPHCQTQMMFREKHIFR
jgi:ribonuclease HI